MKISRQRTILDGLKEEASNVALEQVKKDPKWTFEVLTGELITKASATVGSGEVKLGEANVYKIIGAIAAPIAGCGVVDQIDERVKCVRKVIEKLGGKEAKLKNLPVEIPSRKR